MQGGGRACQRQPFELNKSISYFPAAVFLIAFAFVPSNANILDQFRSVDDLLKLKSKS